MKKQDFPGALVVILAIALLLTLLHDGRSVTSAQVRVIQPSKSVDRVAAPEPMIQAVQNLHPRRFSLPQTVLAAGKAEETSRNLPVSPSRETP